MDRPTFNKFCEEQHSAEFFLLGTKGAEYTQDSQYVLFNFKQNAGGLGIDPLTVWAVYMNKHIAAIKSYVKNKKVKSTESIESRFTDARNYLLLGLALIKESELNG